MASQLWLAVIIVVILVRGKQMPEGASVGIVTFAVLLGLLTALLSGCEPHEYEIPQVGPPPVFDWQASAAVEAYRAPEVRIVE